MKDPSRTMLEPSKEISALKRKIRKLEQLESLNSSIIEFFPDAVFAVDLEGKIILWNKAIEEMTGLSAKKMLNKGNYEYAVPFYGERRPMLVNFLFLWYDDIVTKYSFIKKDGDTLYAETDTPCVLGQNRTLSGKASLLRNKDGDIIGAIESISDITEHKRIAKELLRVHKLESLGMLVGGIAHDFNNLMAVIQGNVQLAMMGLPEFHKSFVHLKAAMDHGEQMKDLTGRLVAFSRESFPVRKINNILEILREVVQNALKGTATQVAFNIEKDLWPVEIDESQIRQVFYNLTVNAIEAMPGGGNLTVQVENAEIHNTNNLPLREGTYLRIVFADNGKGIAEEHLSNIFDPYFTTKDMGDQRGLGLSVCYAALKRHDGHIAVTSRPDEGATFTLYLPAMADKTKETALTSSSSNCRVLIMEDEEHVRKVERAFLEQLGYEVTETKNGQEAIDCHKEAVLSNNPFDLIIMDLLVQNGLDGILTMEKMLREDPYVRAIVVSGCMNDPAIEHYRDYGFLGALKKPFRFDEFEKTVRTVIDTGRRESP